MASDIYLISIILVTTIIEFFSVIYGKQIENMELLKLFIAMLIVMDIVSLTGFVFELL